MTRHHDAGRQRRLPRRRERQGLVSRFRTRSGPHVKRYGEGVLRPAHGRLEHPAARSLPARMLARQGIIGNADRRDRARDGTDRRRDPGAAIAWNLDDEDAVTEHREAPPRWWATRKTPAPDAAAVTTRSPPTSACGCATRSTHPRADRRVPVPPARGRRNPCRHALPGFTHLRVAQPVTFGHHLMACFEMSPARRRALRRLPKRVNRLPLGSAALAGTSYPIDREFVARARLRRSLLQLARRRQRPRLRDRVLRRRALLMTTCRACRG